MRRQAAIVVVIGFCICLALFWYQRLDSSLTSMKGAMKGANGSEKVKIQEEITYLKGMEIFLGIWFLVVFGLLMGCFVHFSHKRYRNRQGSKPTERLILYQTPFQFSILTLLALMLAVGMVFATIKILFLDPLP
jgi:hypothetical protein